MSTPFDSSSIQKAVSNLLNTGAINIPNGHKVAFIVHGDSDGGVGGAFVAKIGNDWRVQSIVDWSHETGLDAGVNLMWSR